MTRLIAFIAWRYLRTTRNEGFISIIAWLSLIGIMLGVATLIIVMSVMNGFHKELLRNIIGISGHLGVSESNNVLKDYDSLAEKIKTIKGVQDVAPFIEGQVLATAQGMATGALVRGMKIEDIERRDIFKNRLTAGSLQDLKEGGIMVGYRLAERLGVGIGDRINLISPEGNVTAFGTVPRSKAYIVVAIFDIGFFQYDAGFIYMPLEEAQLYFKKQEAVDQIEIFTDDPDNPRKFRHEIVKLAERGLNIRDWKQMHGSLSNALDVERNVMFVILTLIILVAALNIISSMIMLVKTKGKDIGILRTMGATKGFVMRVFFWSGASIGLIGTAIGAIIGIVFVLNIETLRQWLQKLSGIELFEAEIYHLTQLPAELNFIQVLMVISVALLLTFLATLYPAWKAARLDPVEALRYE